RPFAVLHILSHRALGRRASWYFGTNAFPDTLRRVPLLARRLAIRFQNRIVPKKCNNRERTPPPTRHTSGGTRSVSQCTMPRRKPTRRSTNLRSVIQPDTQAASIISVCNAGVSRTPHLLLAPRLDGKRHGGSKL